MDQEGWASAEIVHVLFFIVLLYLKKKKIFGSYQQKSNQLLLVFLAVLINVTVLLPTTFSLNAPLIFLSLLLFLLLFQLTKYLETVFRQNYHYQIKEQAHQLSTEHYEELRLYQDQVNTLSSQLQIQLGELHKYVDNADYTQAEAYLQQLLKETTETSYQSFTSHKTLNILLQHTYRQAQSKNIDCHFEVKLPETFEIAETDLIILVGNILDNAVEACEYCEKNRQIKFKSLLKANCFFLSCENRIDGKHQEFTTRKEDPHNHGIGMKSIQRIVEKYRGDMKYEWKENDFQIQLTLFEQDLGKH